ncbi:hypothetical protein [Actinacidiphila paucisporea]|uniref:Uncharacterized protein n=1 Tax=Actinacidiphila paucisporea TaxID=310782 RepID=A0A1M7NYJ4_9ACTN|nr:hypothetical protein [Actinacidiphila paucisporea]SHN09217.1 hypothetical protein SAMN05216499_12061 [Actinacidiphila paucisporea]
MGDDQLGSDSDEETGRSGIWRGRGGATQIIVAVIGVVGAALAAVLTGMFTNGGNSDSSPPPASGTPSLPATSSPPQATPAVSTACGKHLRIVAPQQNYQIADGNLGTTVQVEACDLNGDTGWIFDFDPRGDQAYFLDGTAPYAPIAPSDGSWHIVDQGIGDVGEVNTPHIIYLAEASPQCASALRTAKPDKNGDVSFKTLPTGCTVVDHVDVTVVAYPSESPN